MRLKYLIQVLFVSALVGAGICACVASAQPGNDSKDGKPLDPGKVFDEGQKAVNIATEREAKFKKLCDDFEKSMENNRRAPLNLKDEKLAWDRLGQLIEWLLQECDVVIGQHPKFKDEHELLSAAYDSSISGLQQCIKVLEADAQKEKEDARKDDYLLLARISRTCAERIAARAKLASLTKLEVEKLVKAAEKDKAYFVRAAQVIKLVKQPLEREMVADEFLKRIQRYQEHREQFRKIMRDWSDHLEQTPSSPPTPIKVGSGSSKVPQAHFPAKRDPKSNSKGDGQLAAAIEPGMATAWQHEGKGKDGPSANQRHTSGVPEVKFAQTTPTNKALVIVQLPAAARLYLDDKLTSSQGSERTFLTPELEPGVTYGYTIRIELLQPNGELVTEVRRVSFQAGRQAHVKFDDVPSDVQTASR